MNELSKSELSKTKAGDESAAKVQQDLERSRAKVAASVDAIREDFKKQVSQLTHGASEMTRELKLGATAVKKALSWKTWVARHPYECVAGAFAIGLFLGARRR